MTSRHLGDSARSKLLSAADAREYLGGISSQTLYRLVNEEGLPLIKIRNRSFFHRSDLDSLVRASTRTRR